MKYLPPLKREPLYKMLPNIVTILGICVGLMALQSALQGNVRTALYLLIFTMILDGIDGKIARTLNSESKIGAELDTLADFFNFGIASPLVVYYSIFDGSDAARFGWIAVMIFSTCCALRLARFNVSQNNGAKAHYFVGVPAPILACLGLSPTILTMIGVDITGDFAVPAVIFMIFCAGLAVGTFPTASIKGVTFPVSMRLPATLIAVLIVISFVQFPWYTLLSLNTVYLATIPIYAFSQRAKIKADH